MEARRFASFEEFWPHYVSLHRDPLNRFLHGVGTVCGAVALFAGAWSRSPGFILAAPLLGYLPAWVGHGLADRNRPATWTHPAWSLRADLVMLALALTGRMAAEVERLDRSRS